MRGAFVRTLVELAQRDPRIVLVTGDLGYLALEPFAERFPERFFNVGVAEQNMIGMATGLAEAGFIVFAYSIAPFASLRAYEFIRNGPVLHHLPVRIVGVGGGFEYGPNGPTHYGLEDIGVMRLQPGLTVIAPADHEQARSAFLATWEMPGPVYYRIGKDDVTIVPGLHGRFALGRLHALRDGADAAFIAMGPIAGEAASAADLLAAQGIDCAVAVVACVSPSPVDELSELLARVPIAIVVEAHYAIGGIGSLVSELVATRGLRARVIRCGIETLPEGRSGSQGFLQRLHGLDREHLVETLRKALGPPQAVR